MTQIPPFQRSSFQYVSQLATDLQVASESQEEATAPGSEIVYPPVIATSQSLPHLDELIIFEALPASDLEPTGRHSITVSSAARQLRIFRSGVNQFKESRKRQGVLDGRLGTATARPGETISQAAASEHASG